jgi:hypothetical protein
MTNTERITNLCIEYFNKHDLDTDDEPITASDIRIMSYADIGVGWSAVVYMPNGYIYEIGTLENIYGAVALNKYRRVGGSLYNWEEENSNGL